MSYIIRDRKVRDPNVRVPRHMYHIESSALNKIRISCYKKLFIYLEYGMPLFINHGLIEKEKNDMLQ